MKQYKFTAAFLLLLSFTCFSQTEAAETRRINLLALQSSQANTNFASLIDGNLGKVISDLESNTHVMFATHTNGLKNRDVINVQTDVLRLTSNDSLANDGFNCRFIFDDQSDEDSYFYSISGICDLLTATAEGTKKKQTLIKRTMLPEPSPAFNTWVKLYEDKSSGTVFYVDID